MQRFLDGDVVEAAAPSQLYRIRTHLKKHRKSVAAVLAIAITLLASTIACSIFALSMYRARHALDNIVTELKSKNDELIRAEGTIRRLADRKTQEAAISSALARFNFELFRENTRIVREFMKKHGARSETRAAVETSVVTHEPCNRDLLTLAHREMVEYAIGPLERLIELNYPARRDRGEVKIAFGGSAVPATDADGKTEQYRLAARAELDEQMKALLISKRPEFYRILLREYRSSFEKEDPRIADALDLLAACQIENDNLNEAEEWLRESLAIRSGSGSSGHSNSIGATRKLLALAKSERQNR